ncbi:MAG: hypothetical protein A2Y53_05720 [Chloroflexi bacterium RBG_16_47_49]|nr:MAG: hypothetical protein A2Y53_05720 [Chloroflexi bacterium RBG_16_47_49]
MPFMTFSVINRECLSKEDLYAYKKKAGVTWGEVALELGITTRALLQQIRLKGRLSRSSSYIFYALRHIEMLEAEGVGAGDESEGSVESEELQDPYVEVI